MDIFWNHPINTVGAKSKKRVKCEGKSSNKKGKIGTMSNSQKTAHL